MVKSVENGVSVAPFLVKCYEMVDDEFTNHLISWNPKNDCSFVILDDSKFSAQLLPKYFKHNNFSSFIRQLNIYGFRKVDTDRYEFANDGFVRGQKHLLKSIVRRRQPQVQNKQAKIETAVSSTSEEDKRVALMKEVEILKTDKNVLMQELINLRNHQITSHSKMILLRDQLKGMEKNQQQMLSFIVMAMQNPGFLAQLLQPKENNWRMAENGATTLTPVNKDDCEAELADRAIVRYQPPMNETTDTCATSRQLNSDNPMDWDLSVEEWRELLANLDLTPGLGDEKLSSQENYDQLVLPDAPENYGLVEQLLSSPTLEPGGNLEAYSDMEMGLVWQPKESEDFDDSHKEENKNQSKYSEAVDSETYGISDSIDFLTQELELIDLLSKI